MSFFTLLFEAYADYIERRESYAATVRNLEEATPFTSGDYSHEWYAHAVRTNIGNARRISFSSYRVDGLKRGPGWRDVSSCEVEFYIALCRDDPNMPSLRTWLRRYRFKTRAEVCAAVAFEDTVRETEEHKADAARHYVKFHGPKSQHNLDSLGRPFATGGFVSSPRGHAPRWIDPTIREHAFSTMAESYRQHNTGGATNMPPLKIAMLCHFSYACGPWPGDRTANAYRLFVRELESDKMIQPVTVLQQVKADTPAWEWTTTDRGRVFVEALQKLPLPIPAEPKWVMPS